MKKRTISTLKAIFGSKKGKRRQSSKCSRSPSPESPGAGAPACPAESFRPVPRPPPSPPVPTSPVAPVAPEPPGPVKLIPCAVCGRTFVPQSLPKHVKICEKMAAKRRKTFDSSRQRREGTDLEQFLPKNFGLPENSPFLEKSPPNTAKVAPKPKPQDRTTNRTNIMKPSADLQKCPHCSRAFGVRAFERHVEWCADKAKILPAAPAQPPAHLADAKQRLNARTRYKAPLARQRRSSQTRDKSSNSRSASVESSRGVSPPPPREYGDCRNRRNRASESMSSNDCHDDAPPHVPVIRNSRATQNNSSGDANVKARQARLAKDLNSSRTAPEPNPPAVQHSTTDPNFKKPQNKPVNKVNAKKQQQLKKLEEIANKYNERLAKVAEEKERKINERKLVEKKQIPVLKKTASKKNNENEICEQSEATEPIKATLKPTTSKPSNSKIKSVPVNATVDGPSQNNVQGNAIKKKKKGTTQITKENSMSIDSLDGCVVGSGNDKICQSIGINTELLCVPCIIHENVDCNVPNSAKKKNKTSSVDRTEINARKVKIEDSDEKLEFLYKNLTMVSSCDIQGAVSSVSTFSKSDKCTPDVSKDNLNVNDYDGVECDINLNIRFENNTESNTTYTEPTDSKEDFECDPNLKESHDLSAEHFEEGMIEDHDLSAEHFDDSYEHDASGYDIDKSEENRSENNENENNDIGCRHGSGDTYTKFTENPADLEEFINITDKMISSHDFSQSEIRLEIHVDSLHTPRTDSLETINDKDVDSENPEPKPHFSDTLENLKSDLKELLSGAGDKIDSTELQQQFEAQNDLKTNPNVADMEHITVYGLKFYNQNENKETPKTIDESTTVKLPSISENNRPEQKLACNKKRMQNIYKSNRKFKMLGEMNRDDVNHKTFIVKPDVCDSDAHSITSEAPPLKLPRIENKRIDDTYDPFVSAARQMKELLSSDTNLPKRLNSLNSSKDLTRTLPILRPAKDKAPLSQLRAENSKMIKDTLNKTYQKTPTLQRMKSFGSSNNDNSTSLFGGRCSSFRINRNDKKPSPKLDTTFTKSSKENISLADKTNLNFNRNNNLNRSFSSYTASSYSTPKLKDKIPKIATSMYHSFQRTTINQPVKLDKIKTDDEKKNFVNLDSILVDDNSSMTDSNYIDPRLINENDNLPINVNTILNNPDIISSMESLLTTENLPSKFDSFSKTQNQICELNGNIESQIKCESDKINNNNDTNKLIAPPIENLNAQYEKIMSSLEESIASKEITKDESSVFGDFDLEEFMTTFDEEIHKRKSENKRTCSSTTRVVKQAELTSNRTSAFSSVCSTPKSVHPSSNGLTPVTNPKSFNFSSNNIVSENLFPSSIKRSNSILDSIQKKNAKQDGGKARHRPDQLELDRDLMQSLNDFDKFYEAERNEMNTNRDHGAHNAHNGTAKKDARAKQRRSGKEGTNGNFTPNGKSSNDSAYSSLNRISPSKLSLCARSPAPAPAASDGSAKDERSASSDEFLAMERCAERDARAARDAELMHEKPSRRSPAWRARAALSSSGSEASLAPRQPRFCHECGSKFPLDSAKFCVECGVKRLVL